MVTVVAHTRKLSGFFGRVAQRLYEARLATAEREVNCHGQFLADPSCNQGVVVSDAKRFIPISWCEPVQGV